VENIHSDLGYKKWTSYSISKVGCVHNGPYGDRRETTGHLSLTVQRVTREKTSLYIKLFGYLH
jgi:hypothetical protein